MPDPAKPLPIEVRRAQALRLDHLGAHQRAEALFVQVLATAEARLGHRHPDLADPLNDLARCRFHGGQLLPALHDYRRLLHLIGPETNDGRADVVRHQIRRCIEGMRQRLATAALQAPMAQLIRQARSQRAVGETVAQQRLRLLARRLLARGRVEAGARLMQRWLDDLLQVRQGIDDSALCDLHDHAIALWNAGQPRLAAPVLRAIVLVRQRQRATDSASWASALRDWGACLASAGQPRSARETLALADSMSQPPHVIDRPEEEAPGDSPAPPWAHGLMLDVAQRCTFLFGLTWRSAPRRLHVEVDGELARVGGDIGFDDSAGPWLAFTLTAPADPDPSFPHVEARLCLPKGFLDADDPLQVLRSINRMSSHAPGVSVTLDEDTGCITLSARVVYSGCSVDMTLPPQTRRVLEEVTLNMAVSVLALSQDWVQLLRRSKGPHAQGADDA